MTPTDRISPTFFRFIHRLLLDFLRKVTVVDQMYSNTGQLSFQIMGVSSYVYLLVARTAPQINVNSSSVLMQAPPVGTGFKPDL